MFIIPAFMLCLLFTNLQPRLMITIYQHHAGDNLNIRQILCKFNLFHYGSLFSIYPIFLLTNFNWILFISMSCIIFPQIYLNAFLSSRPNLSSPYYTKYLLSRFLLIVKMPLLSSISKHSLIMSFLLNQTTFSHLFVRPSLPFRYIVFYPVRTPFSSKNIRIKKSASQVFT